MDSGTIYYVKQENGVEVITLKRDGMIEPDETEVLIEETIEPAKPKKTRVTPEQQEEMLVLQSEGKTVQQIAQQLGLKRTTVHEVLKRTNKMVRTNILKLRRMKKKRRKRGKKELLTDEQVDLVNQWLDEDSLQSMQRIVDRLKETCGVVVSKSFVSKIIDDFHYSIIRVNAQAHRDELPQDKKLLALRRDYAKAFIDTQRDFTENEIIFVHFAQFNILIRANPDQPNERSAKRSLFNAIGCALNKEGVLGYKSQYMAMEAEDILAFFTKLLDQLRWKGMERGVIVFEERALDPVLEEVTHNILKAGFECLRLPRASTFLNPIERLFTGWKKITRRTEVFDEKQLIQAIDTADTKLLTTEDCENCYFQALSTLLQCYHGKPFTPGQKTSFRPI